MDNKRILSEEFSIDQLNQEDYYEEFEQPVQTLSQIQNMPQQQQNFGSQQHVGMRVMATGEELARIDNLLQSISADATDGDMFNEQVIEEEQPLDHVSQTILSFEQELIRKLNAKSKPEVKIEEPIEPVCVESTISSISELLSEFSKEIEKTNIFSDEPVRFNVPNNILVRVNIPTRQVQQTESNFQFAPTIEITNVPPIEDFIPVPSNKPQKPQGDMFVQTTTFGVDNAEEFTLGAQAPVQQTQTNRAPQPQRGLDMSDIFAREMERERLIEEEKNKNKPTMTVVNSFESLPNIDYYEEEIIEEQKVKMQVSFTSDIEHDLLESVDIDEDVPQMNTNVNFDDIIGDLLDDKIVDLPVIEEEQEEPLIQAVQMDIPELTLDDNDFNLYDEEEEESEKITMVEQTLPKVELFERTYIPNTDEFVLGAEPYVPIEEKVEPKKEEEKMTYEPLPEFQRTFVSSDEEFVLGAEPYVPIEEKVEPQPNVTGFGEDDFESIESIDPKKEEKTYEPLPEFQRTFVSSDEEFVLGAEPYNELIDIDDVADKEVATSIEEKIEEITPIINFVPRTNYNTISPKDSMFIEEKVEPKKESKVEFVPRKIFPTISPKNSMEMEDSRNIVKRVIKRTTTTTVTKPKEIDYSSVLFNVAEENKKIEIVTQEPSEFYNLAGIFDDNDYVEESIDLIEEPQCEEITTEEETYDLSDDFNINTVENNVNIVEDVPQESFDLTGIFDDELVEETVDVIEKQYKETISHEETYDLSDIFADNDYVEDSIAIEEPQIEEEIESQEEVLEPGDLTLSFDDFYIDAVEDNIIENVETKPLTEEYDLSNIFEEETIEDTQETITLVKNDEIVEQVIHYEEQQMLNIETEEVDEFDDLFIKEEIKPMEVIYQDSFDFNEELNIITQEEEVQTLCNVFDASGCELGKDEFIEAFVNDCEVYDINKNKFNKQYLEEKINNDEIVVFDRFGIHVIKLILLRDIAKAEQLRAKNNEVVSNIYNEFKKTVTKDELIKEYHNNDPHLYDANKTRLNKDEIIEKLNTGELVIGEYGKLVDKDELIILLKDNKTSVYDRYNEQLTKEQLKTAVSEGMDIYDKYENQLTNTALCIKIDSNLIDIKDESGNKVSKEELLREIFGFLDVFNVNQERMTKRILVMYLNDKNLNLYNKNGVLLKTKQIIKIMNDNNIPMTDEHKVLLLGANSNVFDEEGNHLNKEKFVNEYRNVLPRIYNIDGVKFVKNDILDCIKDEIIIVVDNKVVVNKDELIKELKLNLYGVFTKEKEELCREELIQIINTDNVYDAKNNIISKKDLIKKITNSEIIVYDINGKASDIESLIIDLKKEFIGVYDVLHKQLTKAELISNINANNKALFDDTKTLLSNDEINQLLIANNVDVTKYENFFQTRNDKRDFLNINQEDNFVYKDDIYLETPNIVLARKEEDRIAIIAYNESFEARLNKTDDIIKDLYTLLKNKILSYNKIKSKISWDYEAFTHGKFQFAKVDIEDDKVYLFLPLNWNDFINTKYKYKDCSNKKNFEVTCLRFRITSTSELKDCFELVELIASHIHATLVKDFVEVNYYEKHKGFEQLLREDLIKEVTNSKKFSNLIEIDKTSLINNDITSINVSVIKDIPIDEELYNDVINGISNKNDSKNKTVVNIDTISKMYHHDEVVSVESLKLRNIIPDNITYVKCIARGSLEKKLVFELQEYSKDAIKMILLTNGKIN